MTKTKDIEKKVKRGLTDKFAAWDSLMYLHAKGVYTEFQLIDGETLLKAGNIGYYINIINLRDIFVKVHKSWVVNKFCIKALNLETGYFIMDDGKRITIARSYLKWLREQARNELNMGWSFKGAGEVLVK